MIIKYRQTGYFYCNTICPYEESIDGYPILSRKRVGSLACQKCKYFNGMDEKKREVECAREMGKNTGEKG